MSSDKPKSSQKELLESFKKEHGEYPTWNVSKKTPAKTQKAAKVVKTKAIRKAKSTT
jgi:hypothetical protein